MRGEITLKVFEVALPELGSIKTRRETWIHPDIGDSPNPILLEFHEEIHEGFGRYKEIRHHWMFEFKETLEDMAYYKTQLVSPRFVDMLPNWGWRQA